MRIRIDGTYAELAHAINKIRTILPVGTVTPFIPLQRPYTWRVFINTAPPRGNGRWSA